MIRIRTFVFVVGALAIGCGDDSSRMLADGGGSDVPATDIPTADIPGIDVPVPDVPVPDDAGIDVPIVPGILPITNVAKARQFAGQCGAEIPGWMDDLFEGLDARPEARKLVAATVAAEMCRRLYAGGIRHYHFYTLNRADLAYSICHLLGMRPKGGQETGQ